MTVLLLACAGVPPPAEPPPPAPPPAPAPAPVPLDEQRIVGLALGESTTCLVRDDGLVTCHGALGQPAQVLPGALEVDDSRLCARAGGRVRCLHAGLVDDRPTPFVELSRGGGAPCGRDPDGRVFCLSGRDRDEAEAELHPVPLPGRAAWLTADSRKAWAILDDGRLFSWDPFDAMVREPAPELVAEGVLGLEGTYLQTCWWTASAVTCRPSGGKRELVGVQALAVGRAHVCALRDGEVSCWGNRKYGQTKVPPLGPVTAIAAGDDHTCALLEDGGVRCWGRDHRGQTLVPAR